MDSATLYQQALDCLATLNVKFSAAKRHDAPVPDTIIQIITDFEHEIARFRAEYGRLNR